MMICGGAPCLGACRSDLCALSGSGAPFKPNASFSSAETGDAEQACVPGTLIILRFFLLDLASKFSHLFSRETATSARCLFAFIIIGPF